jgi:hypothetical protein
MIGNSSCGIIEYPFTNHRTINVGSRQCGRYQLPTILNTWYNVKDINLQIKRALGPATGGVILSGNYSPSKKIIQVIKENIGKPELLHKKILLGGELRESIIDKPANNPAYRFCVRQG